MIDSIIRFLGFAVDTIAESGIYVLALVRGRTRFGALTFRRELRVIAWQPLPIVTVIAISLGLILATIGNRILENFYVEQLVLRSLGQALVRDLSPLVVGIFVAGRGGIGLATRLGTMVMRREIDALIMMDVSRLRFIVAPFFCVIVISTILLTLWCIAISILSAGLVLLVHLHVTLLAFLSLIVGELTWLDLASGLLKVMIMGVLVTIVAARNGLSLEDHHADLSEVAVQTVIQALLIVILVELVFTLISL